MPTPIETNTASLRAILEKVNSLPEAGGQGTSFSGYKEVDSFAEMHPENGGLIVLTNMDNDTRFSLVYDPDLRVDGAGPEFGKQDPIFFLDALLPSDNFASGLLPFFLNDDTLNEVGDCYLNAAWDIDDTIGRGIAVYFTMLYEDSGNEYIIFSGDISNPSNVEIHPNYFARYYMKAEGISSGTAQEYTINNLVGSYIFPLPSTAKAGERVSAYAEAVTNLSITDSDGNPVPFLKTAEGINKIYTFVMPASDITARDPSVL